MTKTQRWSGGFIIRNSLATVFVFPIHAIGIDDEANGGLRSGYKSCWASKGIRSGSRTVDLMDTDLFPGILPIARVRIHLR